MRVSPLSVALLLALPAGVGAGGLHAQAPTPAGFDASVPGCFVLTWTGVTDSGAVRSPLPSLLELDTVRARTGAAARAFPPESLHAARFSWATDSIPDTQATWLRAGGGEILLFGVARPLGAYLIEAALTGDLLLGRADGQRWGSAPSSQEDATGTAPATPMGSPGMSRRGIVSGRRVPCPNPGDRSG
jgi:hypothetical protein